MIAIMKDAAKFLNLKRYTVIPYAVNVEKYTCNAVAGIEIKQELNIHFQRGAPIPVDFLTKFAKFAAKNLLGIKEIPL